PFKPCPTGLAVYQHGLSLLNLPEDIVAGNYTDHWCSMCMMNFVGSIWALKDDNGSNYKQKIFVVSDQAEIPDEYEGQLILYGNCQAKNRSKVQNNNYIYIKGCPPSQMDVYTTFGKLLYSRKTYTWGLFKRIFKTLGGNKLSWLSHWKEAKSTKN
ncbi:MAG TPA: hypothetical protein VMV49_02265, partial [Candidatus Deferrimicrobium sp.]|nr:hypothetical protein [Candidatus Deferrimicrobium sp.]